MKIKRFYFIFAIIVAGVSFTSCDKENGVNSSIAMDDEVESLNNLFEKLKANDTGFLISYLDKRIQENKSLASQQTQLRVSVLNDPATQQIIKVEYVDPYFEEIPVAGVSVIEYKGNFDFETLINDSRLSLNDREMLLVTYANIEFCKFDEPLCPGSVVKYCDARLDYELYQIACYYFTYNFITLAPIIGDWLAQQWNDRFGMTLVTNNHYADIDAANARHQQCLGR